MTVRSAEDAFADRETGAPTRDEIALLRVVAEATDSTIATDEARDRLVAALKGEGAPFAVLGSAPWHGLASIANSLEAGLIGIDPGVAEFHAPGTPTPSPERFWLYTSAEQLVDAIRQQLRSEANVAEAATGHVASAIVDQRDFSGAGSTCEAALADLYIKASTGVGIKTATGTKVGGLE